MIETALQIFGLISLACLTALASSRYLIRWAIVRLQRQSHRLEAHRCAFAAYQDEYERALKHERAVLRVMGE